MSNTLPPIELSAKQKRWLRKKKKETGRSMGFIVKEIIQEKMQREAQK